MDLQINKDKAEEWVRQGAPTNALSYLGDTVKNMSNFAEQNDILHKDGDGADGEATDVQTDEVNEETADATGEENDASKDETENADTDADATEGKNADETNDDGNSDVVNDDFMVAFSKSLNETITVAIKTYHDEVVVPLQTTIKALTNGVDTTSGQTADTSPGGNTSIKSLFEAFMGEEWLPAAVMVDTIKEQFASDDTAGDDETVEDEEVDATKAAVDKELKNDDSASGHAFTDF